MRGRQLLSYSDAVAILTGDSAALAAADRALDGALSMATGGVSDALLSLFDVQGRVLRLGRDLTSGLRGSLGSADRATRTERIAAAHTVLVVTAYFEALEQLELPFVIRELELTRGEQIGVAGGDGEGQGLVQALLGTAAPQPAPHLPYEQVLSELRSWYMAVTARLVRFVLGLAVWDRLDATQRDAAEDALGSMWQSAVECYQELYAQLAQDVQIGRAHV